MVVARGSAFECAAILEYLYEVLEIDEDSYVNYLNNLEEISKMLYGLIRGLDKKLNHSEGWIYGFQVSLAPSSFFGSHLVWNNLPSQKVSPKFSCTN